MMCRAASLAFLNLVSSLFLHVDAGFDRGDVIVVTEYWDENSVCDGTPIKVDAIRAYTLAMMHYGPASLVCSTLAPNLHAAYGHSMRFLQWNDTGTCALQYFNDAFCEDEKNMRDLYSGACKGWHGGRINRRRLAMLRGHQIQGMDEVLGIGADEDMDMTKPVIPHNIHASAMSTCTNEAVPEGAFDKTCVLPEDLFGLPKVNLDLWGPVFGSEEFCFAKCLGKSTPLRELENQAEFDALFEEGGCAAPCNAEEKRDLHYMLVLDDRIDCNYRPLPVIHEPMVYIPGDPYHERVKAMKKRQR